MGQEFWNNIKFNKKNLYRGLTGVFKHSDPVNRSVFPRGACTKVLYAPSYIKLFSYF
jgi:hypothetical protein